MLRELLYTGVGAAMVMKEKVEEEVNKLEEKGKLKKDDAKALLSALEKKGQEEDLLVKEKIKSMIKEVIGELGIATKEDIEALKKEPKG